MTTWKKGNNTIQENFYVNEKLGDNEQSIMRVESSTQIQPSMNNTDYNIDILHKKMLKIQNKRNNFDKKFVLEDINDYMVEHDAYPDNIIDTTQQPIIIEGFTSPICSGPKDPIIAKNQLLATNTVNFPFFLCDFGLQYVTDVTCNVFAHVSPELIDLTKNINISPELINLLNLNISIDLSGIDLSGVAYDLSGVAYGMVTDISNTLLELGLDSLPDMDLSDNIINDVSNLINNTSPFVLHDIQTSMNLQGTYDQNMKNYKVFTWDASNNTYTFEYDKWDKYINAKSEDNKIVKRNIKYFLLVFVAWFITYNWFFLMFYVDKTGHRIRKYDITQDLLARFNKLLDFLFGPLITPVVWIDKIMMHFIPNFFMAMPILKSPSFQFVLLMFLIYYMITKYSNLLQEILNHCIKHDLTADYGRIYNWFFIFLYVSVMYSFVKSLFDMTPDMLRSTIILIIIIVLRFILVFLLTPVSGVIIVGYLFAYSYFAMIIYNNYNLLGAMEKVRDYIFEIEYAEKNADLSNSCGTNVGNCKTTSLLSTIYDLIHNIHLINYVYIIEVFLVCTLLLSMADYIKNIGSPDLKAGMVILSILTICVIILTAVYRNSFSLGPHKILSKNSKEFTKNFKNSCPA